VKRSDLQQNLAMTMVLISGGMLFATLFMGYAIYRSSAVVWPPVGVSNIELTIPLLSTVVILLSSFFMNLTTKAVKTSNVVKAKMELKFTLGLGLVFMLAQSYFWYHLKSAGVYASSGIFASIIYAYTWIHALHVFFGLVALGWLWYSLNTSSKLIAQRAINVERFWHFLGIIWVIMFITIFVF